MQEAWLCFSALLKGERGLRPYVDWCVYLRVFLGFLLMSWQATLCMLTTSSRLTCIHAKLFPTVKRRACMHVIEILYCTEYEVIHLFKVFLSSFFFRCPAGFTGATCEHSSKFNTSEYLATKIITRLLLFPEQLLRSQGLHVHVHVHRLWTNC